jgi:uncharacterized protein (TIGR03437 family)
LSDVSYNSRLLHRTSALFILLAGSAILYGQTSNPTYRFNTNLGNIDVVLTPNVAPQTVANFLNYVNQGYYTNSIFHRLVNGFVAQGGGYQLINSTLTPIPAGAAIPNEFNVTNAQGTIAMALTSNSSGVAEPNSATSEWFFNLVSNGGQLDSQLFTVFGQTNAAGIAVLNKINVLTPEDLSESTGFSDLTTVPLTSNNAFVLVNSIVPVPVITSQSFTSAASFASSSLTGISPGEIIAIFGTGLGPSQLTVNAPNASGVFPNSLAGTQVFFNGTAAPVIYTSATQVSVVAPYSIGSLPTVSITVSYNGTEPASNLNFPVRAANPAIFTLNSSGTGDGAIERFPAYDLIGASNPASVGDTLILFGEGYGAATAATAVSDGTVVTSKLPVPATPVTVLIDGQPLSSGNILYSGGAPDLINGVLQVNFTVPQLNPGSHQIQLQSGSGSSARTSPMGVTLQTK